jgi:hypothetical protein
MLLPRDLPPLQFESRSSNFAASYWQRPISVKVQNGMRLKVMGGQTAYNGGGSRRLGGSLALPTADELAPISESG